MRTTITLDPDVAALLQERMRTRGESFKATVNDALRAALAPPRRRPYETPTFAMGRPAVPLDKALQVAADLEDEDLIRKLALRK